MMEGCLKNNIINYLKSLKSHESFTNSMLPQDTSTNEIVEAIRFLSPELIIIHGSFVSNIRFSENTEKDLDLIVISYKVPFWNKEYLYKKTKEKLLNASKFKFDTSLETPSGLYRHIENNTSLGDSILRGFTIMYNGDET